MKLFKHNGWTDLVLTVLAAGLLTLVLAGIGKGQTFDRGQVFDPDPSEPYAAETARMRFMGALLGFMSPPVGWDCEFSKDGVYAPRVVRCEPDPVLAVHADIIDWIFSWFRLLNEGMAYPDCSEVYSTDEEVVTCGGLVQPPRW